MQIHPVVSRLCASIQGTSPQRLADCLGIDSSKVKLSLAYSTESVWQDFHANIFFLIANFQFKTNSSEAVRNDSSSLFFSTDDEDR